MNHAVNAAYSVEPLLAPVLVFRMVRLSVDHGVCNISGKSIFINEESTIILFVPSFASQFVILICQHLHLDYMVSQKLIGQYTASFMLPT